MSAFQPWCYTNLHYPIFIILFGTFDYLLIGRVICRYFNSFHMTSAFFRKPKRHLECEKELTWQLKHNGLPLPISRCRLYVDSISIFTTKYHIPSIIYHKLSYTPPSFTTKYHIPSIYQNASLQSMSIHSPVMFFFSALLCMNCNLLLLPFP